LAIKKEEKLYTYDEFRKMELPGDNLYELRDGKIYMMGTPSYIHAVIVQNLYDVFSAYLKGKSCKAFITGLGVRLEPRKNRKDKDQLVPDLTVICDKSKITDEGCEGAPDMVIEVLSPSTASVDRDDKRHKYEKAGVREYWIVAPNERTVETFVLKNGVFMQDCYSQSSTHPDTSVTAAIFPGLTIKLADLFTE
jgi:Uma2 family endonuclease